MPRGILQETLCHHPGGAARGKDELQEELACKPAPRRNGLNVQGPEDLKLLKKKGLRTSYNEFFGGPGMPDVPNLDASDIDMPTDADMPPGPFAQVFNESADDFETPPVGLEQIDATRPRRQPFILEEVRPDSASRRPVEIPIHSPGEAQAFAANYAAASHTPVDVDLDKNQIIPEDPNRAQDQESPDEEVQYWVMEGSDGAGPVLVRHEEHHASHGHHEHEHSSHHHGGKDGMSYSEHEDTVTETRHAGHHGEGGHVSVRHHVVQHVHEPRQRYVPPPPPPDDELRLLDEPQVEPLQPKIIMGGLLAISAQLYLWGNVFVTLFKPNRAAAAGGSPSGPAGNAPEEQPPPPPLVLFGAGGTVGEPARS
ncbi:unnamed protein product [Effrenium voratum]|nr:unnamed protein product [Effrenium voratum]